MQYEIELSVYGDDAPYDHRWLCFETLIACGDTFEQCFDSATLSTVDQDGGEGPELYVVDLGIAMAARYARMIKDEITRQDDKRGKND